MLWHNVTVLLEPWLLDKVEHYAELPAAQKTEYIDRFLDRAELWSKIGTACLKSRAKQGPEGGSSASRLIMEQIAQCSNSRSAGAAPADRGLHGGSASSVAVAAVAFL